MSLGLNIYETYDPRVDSEHMSRDYVFQRCAENVTYRQVTAQSASSSSISWAVPFCAPRLGLGRVVKIELPVTLTWNDADVAKRTIESGFDAFRANPIASISQNLTATINGKTCSMPLSDLIHAFNRFYNGAIAKQKLFSTTPCALDGFQTYEMSANTNSNPLGSAVDRSLDAPFGRGGFPMEIKNDAANDQTIVKAVLTEVLYLPPFCFSPEYADDADCLWNVSQMNFDLTLVANIGERIWSHSRAGTNPDLPAPTVTFGNINEIKLLMTTFTPAATQLIQEKPAYPYFDVVRWVTENQAAVPPGEQVTINSNTVSLHSIPNSIYIFVRQKNSEQTVSSTDTFFAIDNLVVNFGDRVNLLAGCDRRQLYDISRRNGLNMTWQEFSGDPMPDINSYFPGPNGNDYVGPGSLIKLDVADLGQNLLAPAGTKGQTNLSVQVTATNVNPTDDITPALYMIVIYDGVMVIHDDIADQSFSILTAKDVVGAKYKKINPQTIRRAFGAGLGRGFLDGVGNFFKSFLPVLKNDVLPMVKDGIDIYKSVKNGKGRKGKGMVGGSGYDEYYGGSQEMSVSDLRRSLMD